MDSTGEALKPTHRTSRMPYRIGHNYMQNTSRAYAHLGPKAPLMRLINQLYKVTETELRFLAQVEIGANEEAREQTSRLGSEPLRVHSGTWLNPKS